MQLLSSMRGYRTRFADCGRHGFGDETSMRDEIVRANRRYARRQLIWFRKEPNLHWIQVDDGPAYAFRAAAQIVHGHVNPQPARVTP